MTPEHLYKYCDTRGADILRKLRLKITPPNRFNDPFEFAPRMTASVPPEEVHKLIERSLPEIFEEKTAKGEVVGDFKEFKKIVLPQLGKAVQAAVDAYPAVAAKFREVSVDIASGTYGVLCLSAVRDEILMWSHYGEGHKGLVIGLDGRHAVLSSNEPELVEVEYREQRAEMGYFGALQSRDLHEQTKSLIRRKSPHWKYECEWRQLRALEQCETEEDASSSLGRLNYFVPIEPRLICEVIIGCRAPETLIREIAKIKTHSHFAHVQFLQARMHETDFALELGPF
jgi:Protein of unknown function (DUF2971)